MPWNRKKNMKNKMTVIVSCTLLIFLIIGLNGCQMFSGNKKKTVVKYWTGWTGEEMEVQKRLVKRFNEQHPDIEVKINTVASSYEKVKIAFASGGPPDVCSAIWADELASYAMRGALTPLDEYLKKSNRHGEEYMSGIWDMFHYGNHVWALNVTTNSGFIVYNKKMFREAGLDPNKPPITTAEFDKVIEKLAKFDKNGNVIQFGFRPSGLTYWGLVFGGQWYDPKTRTVTADNPNNIRALTWLKSFGKKYNLRKIDAFNSGFASGTYGDQYAGLYGLFTDKVAMLYTGEWSQEHIERYTSKDFEYGYFAPPYPQDGGKPKTQYVGGSVFVIPKDSKNKDAAWEFLNFMTQPEQVKEFCHEIKNIPPLVTVAQDTLFTSNPMFNFAIDLLSGKNSSGPPQMPTWPYYYSEMARVEEKAVFSQEDPKALLQALRIKIQKDHDAAMRDAAYR